MNAPFINISYLNNLAFIANFNCLIVYLSRAIILNINSLYLRIINDVDFYFDIIHCL